MQHNTSLTDSDEQREMSVLKVQKHQCITTRNIKNEGNMVSQKENDGDPVTELKGLEYCHLTDK